MSYPVEFPGPGMKNFLYSKDENHVYRFQYPQTPQNPNWARPFKDPFTNEYNNRRHPDARSLDDEEQHLGNFMPITLNYDPGVNPEIYRFLDYNFRSNNELPPLHNAFVTNEYPGAFRYYLDTITHLQNMYRAYFKVVDGSGIIHIYKKPQHEGLFFDYEGSVELRKLSYLGVYDENLMGRQINVREILGDPLGDRIIIGDQEIMRQSNNNRINRNLEVARRPREYQPPQGGKKKRKNKSKKTKSKKTKSKKTKKVRKTKRKHK